MNIIVLCFLIPLGFYWMDLNEKWERFHDARTALAAKRKQVLDLKAEQQHPEALKAELDLWQMKHQEAFAAAPAHPVPDDKAMRAAFGPSFKRLPSDDFLDETIRFSVALDARKTVECVLAVMKEHPGYPVWLHCDGQTSEVALHLMPDWHR